MKGPSRLPKRAILWTLTTLLLGAASARGATVDSPRRPLAIRYISPVPGASRVLPQTNVIVRFDRALADAARLASSGLDVVGSASGAHAGDLVLSADGTTLLFQSRRPFAWGELVTVELPRSLRPSEGVLANREAFSFTVAPAPSPKITSSIVTEAAAAAAAEDPMSGTFLPPASPFQADSLPATFPVITDTLYGTPSPGRLFLANMSFGARSTPFLIILDESGNPVFYRQMPGACTDFKLQPTGRLTYYDGTNEKFYAMDTSYAVVDSFACGNGYSTDGHELRLLQNGHALLMGYDPQTVDMSQVVEGGNPAASVIGLIVQELDEHKNVVFQWRSWDHFQITDATHEDLTLDQIDYAHGNAIELDRDGNLMISSRNMDEITKISRETGDVLWRWGGKNNQFTFIDDTAGFSHQHAIRRIANGHVTLFDNGNYHFTQYSRGVEYELDEVNKTAREVWEFRNTPDNHAVAMGYVQRLSSGSTLISWGTSKPDIIEVGPDGSKVMEITLPTLVFSYRAFRFEWPPQVPEIPTTISLSPNRPNPFRGTTELTLRLAADANVSLKIYDVAGREVMKVLDNVRYDLGVWPIQVDLRHLRSGLYFCRLVAGGHVETRKILLAK